MEAPSKKVKAFGGLVALGLILVISYPHLEKFPQLFEKKNTQLVDLTPIEPTEENLEYTGGFFVKQDGDMDADGLRDWEEALWGTNPNNPDSDGDGTLDGVEVKKGRNPTIEGPSDFIVQGSTADFLLGQRAASGPQPGNLSDSLSQNLFTTYVDGKEGRISGNEQAEQIVGIAQNALNTVSFQNFYSSSDFNTISSTDIVAIKKYGNDLAEAQIKLLQDLTESDGSLTGKTTFLSIIYRDHSRNLAEFSVPEPLIETHVALTNNFANLSSYLYNVEEYDLDPAKAMFSLQQYEVIRENVGQLTDTIPQFFRNSGIVFTKGEPGNLWNIL